MPVRIVIPTYQCEGILLDTVNALLLLDQGAAEILLLDQTRVHDPDTDLMLALLQEAGFIQWLKLERPSIPGAMNQGLVAARESIVLFLNDDIIPAANLIATHVRAHRKADLIAGQVLQPGEQAIALEPDESF